MANKLFESLGGGRASAAMTNDAVVQKLNTPTFWNQVDQMKRSIANPQAQVQELLASGQMSQAEFQHLSGLANMMMGKR